jgi:hypothetical protein
MLLWKAGSWSGLWETILIPCVNTVTSWLFWKVYGLVTWEVIMEEMKSMTLIHTSTWSWGCTVFFCILNFFLFLDKLPAKILLLFLLPPPPATTTFCSHLYAGYLQLYICNQQCVCSVQCCSYSVVRSNGAPNVISQAERFGPLY